MSKTKLLPNKTPTNIIHLGYMPLTDCAPIVVAYELGFFTETGLTVRLEKQYSWAVMQDKLHAGVLDAAQCLAPMPLASALGLSSDKVEVIAPMILSQNGNAITISEQLYDQVKVVNQLEHIDFPLSATLLKPIIKKRKRKKNRLKFATVYPDSCHYYQLCSWFEHSGIRLSDIEIIIVTPSNMVEALACGDIDGFCVGGPWNAKAVRDAVGVTGVTSCDVWPDMPEKVLAFLNQWYQQHSSEAHALICALQKACNW
ncbi:CmpA/NrtA family ABC transporter substrate-binding protein [Thalassotalea hakodatensis]|uniref:CmpA/NrtA family ABC transporter substrate-binding protein n=1 Tax=Thalassotalea hakodatensis TaxID=3030492 RepID=UPI002572A2B2|nr:CmpA/NrtA family ABC transporter substrate-binding protein [Thalassotalea hakodatensis]